MSSIDMQKSLSFGNYFSKFLPKEDKEEDDDEIKIKPTQKKKRVKIVEEKSSKSTTRSKRTKFDIENDQKDDDVDPIIVNIKQKLMKGENPSMDEVDYLPAAIEEMKTEQDAAYEERKYVLYGQIDEAIARGTDFYAQVQKNRFKHDYETRYVERAQNAEKELHRVENERANERKEFVNHLREKCEALQQKHNEELEDFVKDWHTENKLKKYNRSSSKFRELNIEVCKLRAAKRFDEIKDVEAQIQAQLSKETDMNEHRLQQDYNEALQLLLEKQAKELETLQKANRVRLESFDAKTDADIRVVKLRIAKLERPGDGTGRAEVEWRKRVAEGSLSNRSLGQMSAKSWRKNQTNDYLFIPIKNIPSKTTPSRLNYNAIIE